MIPLFNSTQVTINRVLGTFLTLLTIHTVANASDQKLVEQATMRLGIKSIETIVRAQAAFREKTPRQIAPRTLKKMQMEEGITGIPDWFLNTDISYSILDHGPLGLLVVPTNYGTTVQAVINTARPHITHIFRSGKTLHKEYEYLHSVAEWRSTIPLSSVLRYEGSTETQLIRKDRLYHHIPLTDNEPRQDLTHTLRSLFFLSSVPVHQLYVRPNGHVTATLPLAEDMTKPNEYAHVAEFSAKHYEHLFTDPAILPRFRRLLPMDSPKIGHPKWLH